MENKSANNIKYISPSNPLSDMVDICKYYPLTKSFQNTQNENVPLFEQYFPKYFSFIKDIENIFVHYLQSNYDSTLTLDRLIRNCVEEHLILYEDELNTFIGDCYITLTLPTKRHTNIFFHLAYQYINSSSSTLSDYEKNVLYWTILFHDLGKHQKLNPYIHEDFTNTPLDKTHPFKSVIIFIKTLLNNKLIPCNDEFIYKYEAFCDCLYKSYKMEDINVSLTKYNLSFIYIENIIEFLNYLKQWTWIYEVVILILFHQSLPNNEECMNYPLLPNEYVCKLFDYRMLELMRIVMVYDSCSHSLFKGGNWVNEINKQLDKVRTMLQVNNNEKVCNM